MDMIHKGKKEFFEVVSLWYIILGSGVVVVLTVFSPFLIKVLTTPAYYPAWKVVGILSWGSIFHGFYLISGIGIFYSRKTYLNNISYGAGALLNIILNYFWTLKYGLLGTASATVVSLFFSNIINMYISHKFFPVKWKWQWMLLSIILSFMAIFYVISARGKVT